MHDLGRSAVDTTHVPPVERDHGSPVWLRLTNAPVEHHNKTGWVTVADKRYTDPGRWLIDIRLTKNSYKLTVWL